MGRKVYEMRRTSVETLFMVIFFSLSAHLGYSHATLVLGNVTVDPNPPVLNDPFRLTVIMTDPILVPIEDAIVKAELTSSVSNDTIAIELIESEVPGIYRGPLTLDNPGAYTLLLRDQTFRQEEATATLELIIGTGEPIEPIAFVFPPTATTSRTISTWLIWIVGIPTIVALIVTAVVVFTNQRPEEKQ